MAARKETTIAAADRRTRRGERTSSGETPAHRGRLSFGTGTLLFAVFLGAALSVYEPALKGAFVSDDWHYVANNSYVHELSVERVGALFVPLGGATTAVVNYTPVHLLLHTAAWEAFGDRVYGHHVVNVVFHCLASVLLVALFLRTGIPRAGAILGGVIFLLHPANVEAVAWISQLKSSSSLFFSLLALLAMPRRPGFACLLFVLALFAKPTAAFVLPVALLFDWTQRPRERLRWKWYAVMAAAFAAYAVVEFIAHQRAGAAEAILHETPFVLVRTVLALGMRYLVIAATSYGLSAFHDPEPAFSVLDPWWLASLVVLGLLAWRLVVVLRGRKVEAAYWAWAVVSYAPISQVFPFLYPMADRYLYFILPGLIGAVLLAGNEVLDSLPGWIEAHTSRLAARLGEPFRARRLAGRAGLVLGVAAAALFAVHSHGRAAVWRSPATVMADAAAHYPNGAAAGLRRGQSAAQMGDVDGAVAGVRAAMERGYNRFEQLLTDPTWAPVRDHPKFRAVVREIAAGWIETMSAREDPTQIELVMLANAYYAHGDKQLAAQAFRRALERGGPNDDFIRAQLAGLGGRVD